MPIAHSASVGQTAATSSADNVTVTLTSAVNAGEFLTLAVTWFGSSSITGVTDNSGASPTYVVDGTYVGTDNAGYHIGFVSAQCPAGLASGTVITVAFTTFAAIFGRTIQADTWTSVISTGAHNATSAGSTASAQTWDTGTVTTTVNGELVLGTAWADFGSSTGSTPNAPAVELADFAHPDAGRMTTVYEVRTVAGAASLSGSFVALGGNQPIHAFAVSYLPALSAGGQGVQRPGRHRGRYPARDAAWS